MVWNTTQSTLSKAVNDYNQAIDRQSCKETMSSEDFSEDYTHGCNQKSTGCHKCDNRQNYSSRQTGWRSEKIQPFSKPVDKDFLLIAGLICILLREGADNKLILALAIILLG